MLKPNRLQSLIEQHILDINAGKQLSYSCHRCLNNTGVEKMNLKSCSSIKHETSHFPFNSIPGAATINIYLGKLGLSKSAIF